MAKETKTVPQPECHENAVKTGKHQSHEKTIRRLAFVATLMIAWLLIWALVLKLGDEYMLVRNYSNLKEMTIKERILWDIVPFRYRGEASMIEKQKIVTVLNCFVLAPLAIVFCYVVKKPNVWGIAALCFLVTVGIETLQLCTFVGNPATEDLMTNTVGGFIGYGIYRLVLRRWNGKWTIRLFIVLNVILFIAVVVSIVTIVSVHETLFKILTKTL